MLLLLASLSRPVLEELIFADWSARAGLCPVCWGCCMFLSFFCLEDGTRGGDEDMVLLVRLLRFDERVGLADWLRACMGLPPVHTEHTYKGAGLVFSRLFQENRQNGLWNSAIVFMTLL